MILHRGRFGRLVALALLLAPAGAALLTAAGAAGHAIVLEATPDVGATVAGPEVAITIRFNSRIDHRRSRLTVLPKGGTAQVLGIDSGAGPAVLRAGVRLADGAYTLRWQVLAEDGHITRGDIPFQVRH